MEKTIKKIYIFFLIFLVYFIVTQNTSKAVTNFKKFDNAPRILIKTDKNKYDDVKIIFTDYSKLNMEKIKIYLVDGEEEKEIPENGFIKSKKVLKVDRVNGLATQWEYTISNNYLNKQTKKFHIIVTDNKGQYINTYLAITDHKGNYGINYAPRIKNWKIDKNKVTFTVRDLAGTKIVKVFDINDGKKLKERVVDLEKDEENVSIDISKFNIKDGQYRLLIKAEDVTQSHMSAKRTICFETEEIINKEEEIKNDTESQNNNQIQNNNEEEIKVRLKGGVTQDSKDENTYYLMIDDWYYKYADLKLEKISGKNYSKSDIKWKIEDDKVIRFTGGVKNKEGVSKVTIIGKNFGSTEIQIYIKGKLKIKCKVKVIISSRKKAPTGDIAAPTTNVEYHNAEHPYWIRKKSEDWGTEYVEAYVNNAAKLISEEKYAFANAGNEVQIINGVPSYRKREVLEKTIYRYRQADLKIKYDSSAGKYGKMTVGGVIHWFKTPITYGHGAGEFEELTPLTKKRGELSPNQYVILFIAKNQWLYLLKKENDGDWDQEKNRWKLVEGKASSAGLCRDRPEQYCILEFRSEGGLAMRYAVSWSIDTNLKEVGKGYGTCNHLLHSSYGPLAGVYNKYGQPTSHGCIHVGDERGDPNTLLYYLIMKEAGTGTRLMMM